MKFRMSRAADITVGVLLGFYVLDHVSLWVLLIGTVLAIVIEHEFL